MTKCIGVGLLIILSPLLIVIALSQVITHWLSLFLLGAYNFIYFPVYRLAGTPFDQQGKWKWNQIKSK